VSSFFALLLLASWPQEPAPSGWYVCRYQPKPAPEIGRTTIQWTIQNRRQEVRACYNRALMRDRTAQGRVVLVFMIGSDGSVDSVVIQQSDIADQEFRSCVTDVVRGWVFPVGEDNTEVAFVTYPFVFRGRRSVSLEG
jgi:outer membrane biosynthesis protein TonB